MKKITILLFTAAAMAAGCKKFTDINQNPNSPAVVTPNVVLSAALNGSASALGTDFFNVNEWMGYWSRSGNYIAVQSTEQYALTTGFADGDFQDQYSTMSKYNYIEQTALANPVSQAFYAGVAKTMKALHFSTLVDGFGNVPYSQAFQVLKYPTPAYDDAQTIYNSLVTQLDSAVYYFNAATTYYKTASSTVIATDDKYDIMFGRGAGVAPATRMAEWIKFANTVKLKLLMTESQVASQSYIAGEIAKSVASGGFLGANLSASVNPGYGSATQAQVNPFFGAFYTNSGSPTTTNNFYRANNYALNFYNGDHADGSPNPTGTVDNTRPYYVYTYFSNGSIVGNYDGDPASIPNSGTSGIGNFSDKDGLTKTYSQDQLIMSDFESLFLQAEATARGYNVGKASGDALLQSAIEQNYIYLGDNQADADAYYASGSGDPNVSYTYASSNPIDGSKVNADPTPGLQAVMTQKWIALNGINWMQAWTDFRRTQFPLSTVLSISHANAHVKNAIPYRFLYPASEFSTNGKNVPSLANAQYTPIFWDKFEK